jgi:ribose 5-phosphate isomerase B
LFISRTLSFNIQHSSFIIHHFNPLPYTLLLPTFVKISFTYMQTNFNLSKPVALGADHAGFEYKKEIVALLQQMNISTNDFGTHTADSVDYPDFAHPVASMVESGEAAFGILVCGSGNGVAITANKHAGVRAALCWNEELAKLARNHNNANVLCIPERFTNIETAKAMVKAFIETPFEAGRHEKRVEKISC